MAKEKFERPNRTLTSVLSVTLTTVKLLLTAAITKVLG
jgi:hypothetical protein